ncbi:MAG: NYN domain-containing protein [Candidatus Brocadiales bacterium]|nr:NYN domain-containing protein [Candidatus Bathyanammoxibius amoris]
MHIIIDGYNLIFAVPELVEVMDKGKMETAREVLLAALSDYEGKSRQKVTVVFDGRDKEGDEYMAISQKQHHGGVNVIFSKGTTADEDIKDIINSSPNTKNMCIVTSDKSIIQTARSSGCKLAEPGEFYKKITPAPKKGRASTRGEPLVKYREVPEEQVDYWLKVFKAKREKE